ncbi:MAG: hypothetical protein ACI87W_001345, partial [Halieaceae bacterium]
MKAAPKSPVKSRPYEGLSADTLLTILAEKDVTHEKQIQERDQAIQERDTRIKLLEDASGDDTQV